ncbi:MAG: TIGR00266 family protein [Clostridiales bacterium]|nr:MAG: TIGR00266 family protein [Clostridiales bacterium]
MKYSIHYKDTFSLLEVQLNQGEALKAESGAMVSMDSTVDVEGKLEGGLLKGLGRMFAGESFFFQTLAANRGPGNVTLAPTAVGSIVAIPLNGDAYNVQKNGFLAASMDVNVDTKMQSLTKGLLSGEGLVILNIHGTGVLFVSSHGAIHEIDIPAGKEVIIDNGHLVAWPSTVSYKIEKASKGWISSVTSGEAVVCRFTGPGKVYIQTRNPNAFIEWISKLLPSK